MSSEALGLEVDYERVLDRNHVGQVGVPHSAELLTFTNAVQIGTPDLDAARAQLGRAVGADGVLEAAATIAVFNGLVRVADGTGIALDEGVFAVSTADRAKLGIDSFSGAANSGSAAEIDPSTVNSIGELFGDTTQRGTEHDMDLKTRGVPPTEDERAAVDVVLGPPPARDLHDRRGGHELRGRRHLLLPTLHAVNDRIGWISQPAIDYIAERLDASPAEIYGVASFYALFSLTERPPHQVHVCVDLVCRSHGGVAEADLPAGAHASPCLGLCERAPAAFVTTAGDPPRQAVAGHVTPVQIDRWAGGEMPGPEADPAAVVRQAGDESLVLLGRAGRVDPLDLDAYLADRGFTALERARRLGPEATIAAVTASGLTGRGGAGFPTGRKWDAVRTQTATPHYLVANADESEPGTFKDRVLIENDPFGLIESMSIAALATGCERRIRLHPRRVPAAIGNVAAGARDLSPARAARW